MSGLFLVFPAIALFSEHLPEGAKTPRSLREERKAQTSSLICKEKVNTVVLSYIYIYIVGLGQLSRS